MTPNFAVFGGKFCGGIFVFGPKSKKSKNLHQNYVVSTIDRPRRSSYAHIGIARLIPGPTKIRERNYELQTMNYQKNRDCSSYTLYSERIRGRIRADRQGRTACGFQAWIWESRVIKTIAFLWEIRYNNQASFAGSNLSGKTMFSTLATGTFAAH